MPFDVAGWVAPSTLINDYFSTITIAESRAQAWREHVMKKFIGNDEARARSARYGSARWIRTADPVTVNYHLRHAPKIVRQLARDVKANYPGVALSIEWFYDDPILYAYAPEYAQSAVPLAIWDKRIVRAIAADQRLSLAQRVLRRYVHTV